MPHHAVDTVYVKGPGTKGPRWINESDFDESKHEIARRPSKKKAAKMPVKKDE